MVAGHAVVASHGGVAIGQLYYQRREGTVEATRLEPRPTGLVGREELIRYVHTRLHERGTGPGPALLVLTGLGGVGKTSLALEYAHRVAAQFQVVWSLRAGDPTALRAQFAELARLLDPDDVLDRADPVARVHSALAGLPGRWLLVLDNVPDPAGVRDWLPAKGNGQVLVTSPDGRWPGAVEVPGLDLPTATQLLLDRTRQSDVDGARDLALELGLLPLALEQAAGYVAATGRRLGDYLTLLRADRARLLARGAAEPVAATWDLALADLAAHSPGSVTLLRVLACLAPERIPLRLLFEPDRPPPPSLRPGSYPADSPTIPVVNAVTALGADPLALDDAVAGLRRYSLIGPPGETVSLHRLVQAITLDRLDPAARPLWRAAAASLVNAAIPKDITVRPAWPACAALLPHARVVLHPTANGRWRLAGYLGNSGDYATAREMWSQLVEASISAYGESHRETLAARANLAFLTGEAGDAVAARDQYAALLPLWENSSGPEHPQTLVILGHLARWTGHAGDPETARRLYAKLLPLRVKALGPEDPATLTAWDCLARCHGETGDPVAARDQYAALVPVRVRVSGPEHQHTLTALANLAFWTGRSGDAVAARDRYAELLPLSTKVSGPEHPETLTVWDNLANWTGRAGDPARARDLYAALLPVRERVSGPDHPHTRNARDNLAFWSAAAACR